MLKYTEVVTNLDFIKVSTSILEIRAVIRVDSDTETEDGAYVIVAVEDFWRLLDQDKDSLHTQNQLIILNYQNVSEILVDNIAQVGIRPPELHQIINKPGDYYGWIVIKIKVKIRDFPNKIKGNLSDPCWVDGLQK